MHWYVYRSSLNGHEMKEYDVFEHRGFAKDVAKLKRKKLGRDEFSDGLKSIAMYYFWSKSEHEIILASWPPYISGNELIRLVESGVRHIYDVSLVGEKKVDIYQQLALNWDVFVDYVYGGKNEH